MCGEGPKKSSGCCQDKKPTPRLWDMQGRSLLEVWEVYRAGRMQKIRTIVNAVAYSPASTSSSFPDERIQNESIALSQSISELEELSITQEYQ